jgi:hypothetical protein
VNAQITIGAAVELAVLIVAALYSRWWVSPRPEAAPYSDGDITVETPLDELMGDWPEPATGAVVAQAWRWCADCMRMESGLLHSADCWRCGHCLEVAYAGAEAAS